MAVSDGAGTGEQNCAMSELTGAALLLVVGEPFTNDHKELIVETVTKGEIC